MENTPSPTESFVYSIFFFFFFSNKNLDSTFFSFILTTLCYDSRVGRCVFLLLSIIFLHSVFLLVSTLSSAIVCFSDMSRSREHAIVINF